MKKYLFLLFSSVLFLIFSNSCKMLEESTNYPKNQNSLEQKFRVKRIDNQNFEYDENNNLVKRLRWRKGKIDSGILYKYNSHNQLVKETRFYKELTDEMDTSFIIYQYDSPVARHPSYEISSSGSWTKFNYIFDGQDRIIKEESWCEHGYSSTNYLYYPNGNLAKIYDDYHVVTEFRAYDNKVNLLSKIHYADGGEWCKNNVLEVRTDARQDITKYQYEYNNDNLPVKVTFQHHSDDYGFQGSYEIAYELIPDVKREKP